MSADLVPLHAFRYHISIRRDSAEICNGAFAECTGLEATMEPKVIKAGGANYGATQRPGTVSFATVVLKRGMTSRANRRRFSREVPPPFSRMYSTP